MGDGDTSLQNQQESSKRLSMLADIAESICSDPTVDWSSMEITLEGGRKHLPTDSEKYLIIECARLGLDAKTMQAIWLLTLMSPRAVEMTVDLLREMDVATKHQALGAMARSLARYPTPEMIRLQMKE